MKCFFFFFFFLFFFLPTFTQRYNKKIILFLIQFKKERLTDFYRLSSATFYDRINTIYQFIKSFLDTKCLFLRTMKPLIIHCKFQL